MPTDSHNWTCQGYFSPSILSTSPFPAPTPHAAPSPSNREKSESSKPNHAPQMEVRCSSDTNMSWTPTCLGQSFSTVLMKTCWMMLDDAGCDMILTCIATVRFWCTLQMLHGKSAAGSSWWLHFRPGCRTTSQWCGKNQRARKAKTDKARSRQAGLLSHKDPSAMTSLTIWKDLKVSYVSFVSCESISTVINSNSNSIAKSSTLVCQSINR